MAASRHSRRRKSAGVAPAKALVDCRFVPECRLVGSDPRAWHRNWTDYGVSGAIAIIVPHRLSRKCHGSRGKWWGIANKRWIKKRSWLVPFHRNSLILLGKLPLRQIVITLLKWLLTEECWFRSGRASSLVSFWRLRRDRQQVKTAPISFERPGRLCFQVNFPYFL